MDHVPLKIVRLFHPIHLSVLFSRTQARLVKSTPRPRLNDLGDAVNDFLLSNQMTGFLDQSQQCVNILRPLVQDLVRMLRLCK